MWTIAFLIALVIFFCCIFTVLWPFTDKTIPVIFKWWAFLIVFVNVFQHHTITMYIDELNQSHNIKISKSKFVRYLKKTSKFRRSQGRRCKNSIEFNQNNIMLLNSKNESMCFEVCKDVFCKSLLLLYKRCGTFFFVSIAIAKIEQNLFHFLQKELIFFMLLKWISWLVHKKTKII